MADDVGEALDLVIGFAQVGGALVDRGLEVEVVVAQVCFGLVARARRAPHQEDRKAGERDHEAGAGDGHGGGEHLRAIRASWSAGEQPIFLGAHGARGLSDGAARRRSRCRFAQQRDAGGDVLVLDAIDAAREFGQPRFDRAAQLA